MHPFEIQLGSRHAVGQGADVPIDERRVIELFVAAATRLHGRFALFIELVVPIESMLMQDAEDGMAAGAAKLM